MKKKNILIISHGEIGTQMAGTGIRYHYMAETLSKHFNVTVGFFSPEYMPDAAFKRSYAVESVNVHHFEKSFSKADVVIALWVNEAIIDFCNKNNKILIIDMYAPVPVETLALKIFSGTETNEADAFAYESSLKDYRLFLENGDAFLCSNRRQIDYWLGFAFGANQITIENYKKRDTFQQFLLAPMGIATAEKLIHSEQVYKDIVPGISKDDILIVWNGGIYDWYDGVTLIEAMALVAKKNPHIKLAFPGIQHPNKTLPKWKETVDTIKKAEDLGLLNKNVFLADTWIDYNKRVNFLLEADIAIYTHKPSIESEFSHRTRVLDHILASLPTIATKGDFFADIVEQNDIGITVPHHDKNALAEAIINLAKPAVLQNAKSNIAKIRASYDWDRTLAPLVSYIESNPHKMPQVNPVKLKVLQGPQTNFIKKLIPVKLKILIVRALPKQLRNKLFGL